MAKYENKRCNWSLDSLRIFSPRLSASTWCNYVFHWSCALRERNGAASKLHWIIMDKCGCSIYFWLMEACDFGAAASQLCPGVLYTKESPKGSSSEPKSPSPNALPASPRSNLHVPFGVPTAVYTKRKPVSSGNSITWCFPCISNLKCWGLSPYIRSPKPHGRLVG